MTTTHTPGPWRWEFNRRQKVLHLAGGRPMYDSTIMDFDRWGMNRADWIEALPGREQHTDWCAGLAQPDLRLIAAAPDLLRLLIEARATLEMWKDVAPAISLCADIDAATPPATIVCLMRTDSGLDIAATCMLLASAFAPASWNSAAITVVAAPALTDRCVSITKMFVADCGVIVTVKISVPSPICGIVSSTGICAENVDIAPVCVFTRCTKFGAAPAGIAAIAASRAMTSAAIAASISACVA